jgi:hypothetical protein
MLASPVAAFAQQMPQPPDGTSINEAPAAAPAEASVDACGNTPQAAFGQPTDAGAPQNINDANPKDITGAQPVANMSSVTGFVVHSAGDLVLLQISREPAAGTDNPTPATPDKSMAVIRLPQGCGLSLNDGMQIKAVGVPSTAGILNAEQLQVSY